MFVHPVIITSNVTHRGQKSLNYAGEITLPDIPVKLILSRQGFSHIQRVLGPEAVSEQ